MTKPIEEEKIVVDLDGNIKEAIEQLFEDWIEFFFPEMYPKVDFSKKPVSLQQEFQNIITFPSGNKKIVDKLFEVTMKSVLKTVKSGTETKIKTIKEIILVHVEAETSPKSAFVRRMFLYAAVAIAKHNRVLTALVMYTGKRVPKRRNAFEMSCYGTSLYYAFNAYVVAEQDEEALIESNNIFALIILAIKYVIDSPNDYAKRFAFKKKLFELLLERNYPYEKRRILMTFVKEIMKLPTALEKDFLTFAKIKVDNKMTTKKQQDTVKARLKQAEKEWANLFAEVFYGAPVEVLLENKAVEVTKEVTKEVTAKKNRAVVLHLYHTIGLSVSQIAETVDLSIGEVQGILNSNNGSL